MSVVVETENKVEGVVVPMPMFPTLVTLKMSVVVAIEKRVEAVEVPIATLPVVEATYRVGEVEVPTLSPPQISRVAEGVEVAMPILPVESMVKMSPPCLEMLVTAKYPLVVEAFNSSP